MPKKCPDCGGELKLIKNSRMDEREELIPICENCGKAWRYPHLGWRIDLDEKAILKARKIMARRIFREHPKIVPINVSEYLKGDKK